MAIKYRPGPGGSRVAFNISTPTLVTAANPTYGGTVFRVYVNTVPSSGGAVYDSATVGGAGPTNLIIDFPSAPNKGDILVLLAPFYDGLVIDPGNGGVVSVSYE